MLSIAFNPCGRSQSEHLQVPRRSNHRFVFPHAWHGPNGGTVSGGHSSSIMCIQLFNSIDEQSASPLALFGYNQSF